MRDPATALVDIAKGFAATIRVRHGDRAGDAKSLIALLNLGVESGATIRVMAEGPDADRGARRPAGGHRAGLEEERRPSRPRPTIAPIAWEGPTVAGVAASPGMAAGPVWQYQRGKIVVAATARDPAAELTRLERADRGRQARARRALRGGQGQGRRRPGGDLQGPCRVPRDRGLSDGAGADPRRCPQRRLRLGEELHGAGQGPGRPKGRPAGRPRRRPARRWAAGCCACWPTRIEDEPKLPDTAGDPDRRRPEPVGYGPPRPGPGARHLHRRRRARPPTPPSSPGPRHSGRGRRRDSVLDIADGTAIVLDGDSGTLVLDPSEADRPGPARQAEQNSARRSAAPAISRPS
jgi:multiphosphoryl transfer protein